MRSSATETIAPYEQGVDVSDAEPESDIRKRAAYLLGMLAVVAALFVVLMVVFFNTSGGDPDGPDGIAGPSDVSTPSSNVPTSAAPTGSGPTSSRASSSSAPASTDETTPSGTDSPSSGSGTSLPAGSTTCPAGAPAGEPCALDGDPGQALDAINDYRAENGKGRVSGSVSKAAQRCAVNNGSGCSGGWAETQVAKADGKLAVNKIQKFGKLLSDMSSVELGWAYDPDAKQYYFAIIRQD